jgi:hypothetical protein
MSTTNPLSPSAPRPIAAIAAVIGIVAAVLGSFTPVVAFALPGALGAIAIGLSFIAGNYESKVSIVGLLGGAVALIYAVEMYGQYQDAMDTLGGIGGF